LSKFGPKAFLRNTMTHSPRRKPRRFRLEPLEPRLPLATILVVSDANPPTVAGGDHEDDELVAWLQSQGHDVDTSGMGQAMREGGLSAGEMGRCRRPTW
jgi:hypothetical protein